MLSISNPTVALAPGASAAFQLTGDTVTVLPEVVVVPFQRLPNVPPAGMAKDIDHVERVVVPEFEITKFAV